MKQKTVFGTLLNNFRFQRQMAREKTERELWQRNKLDNPTLRDGHKIVETAVVGRDGKEAIKFELWRKIDESVVIIGTSVTSEVVEPESKDDIEKLLNG